MRSAVVGSVPVALLACLFFLSGAAGLMYESIWARYLGLFVGHDAYGQITVLVIFLGGMALGAAAVSRATSRIRSPLVGYAAVELVVGVMGFGFHPVYLSLTGYAHESLYPALAGTWTLSFAKWVLAGALILPQSLLLGSTFPLMSAGVLRLGALPKGRVLGLLYFANSLGAAAGVLVAGFYLLGLVGLPGTLRVAAGLNLIAGIGTFLVALLASRGPAGDAAEPAAPLPAVSGARVRHFLLVVSFGTALASFLYEIGWIRMLSLVLGSATHSFELMLSAFILGLALGAWWIRSRADRIRNPLLALGIIQWLMGGLALATLPVYADSFGWMSYLLETFARTDGGYLAYTVSRYGLCLAVMFPATFLAGTTLPLITRTLMEAGEGEKAVGAVYAVNTFGSIIGVVLGGLVLLPWIGLKATLIVGAAVDMGLGVSLLRSYSTGRRLGHALLAGTAIVLLAGWQLVDLRKGRLTSGVYRRGSQAVPDEAVVFYRDGRTATVSGVRLGGALTYLATNGKADASLTAEWLIPCHVDPRKLPLASDAATQTLSALVALAHAPRARLAAVIGHGSGISSHHLLASPALQRLATV
jgi:spermidine synthase